MSLKFKYFWFAFSLLFFATQASAQRYHWAKFTPKTGAIGTSITIDSNSNTYMMGLYVDTIFIDSNAYPPEAPAKFNGNFLAKFDKYGNVKWCKQLYVPLPSSTSYAHFYIQGLMSLSKNRLLVYGNYDGGGGGAILKLSKNDSIVSTVNGCTGFMAVYDSLGNVIKSTKVFEGEGYSSGHFINEKCTKDSKGNIYFQFCKGASGKGRIHYIGGSVALTDTFMRNVVVKLSPNLDSVLWYKQFPNWKNFWVLRISNGEDDNLYLACNGLNGSFTLDGKNYRVNTSTKGFISVLSPSGSFVHNGFINEDTTKGDQLLDMKAKNIHSIYFLGLTSDSMLIKGKWYKSAIKKKSTGDYPYIGKMSITNGAKWVKFSPNTTALNIYSFGGNIPGRIAFDKFNSVYASFYLWSQGFSIGGLSDTSYVTHPFMKLDSVGNALWIRNMTFRTEDFQADYDTNVLIAGAFGGQIYFNPFTLKSKYTSLYLAKIIDYSIKRGFVSNGPYCAGDTIKVPYSKRGIYDTSNYFIAELSDENGNFEGNERELGRLKTIDQGNIKGLLPMFKVASSNQYRIRVRSTNPIVQSFYKVDTLRLLIYSRDKADPGPAESICYGDTFKLNTYGGTKWTWSPKYNMSDTSSRQPLIWPTSDTLYKIIIDDSSGCGAPDTAYKKIKVRKPLKLILDFNDTFLCSKIRLNLPIKFGGGDSMNYIYKWYYLNSPKDWFLMKNGKFKLYDTLYYYPSEPKETLAIVLNDGCTNKADTAYLSISQRNPVVIKNQFWDTVMCSGNTINYKAIATGGVANQYKYQWKDLISNTIFSNTDSLKIKTSKTLKIQLIVNDGCEALGDTAEFEVKVKVELKAITNLRDTTICSGKTLNYTAQATGGDSKNYTYSWLLSGKEISTSNLLNLKSDILNLTSNLSLITSDNCSPNDTITKIITVLPSPKADFTWDLACSRTVTKFKFKGTIPNSPITTQFNWNFNNEASSSIENPFHLFSTVGKKNSTLILTSNNGCTDTIKKTIEVKFQSTAQFTANDVCESDSAIFINISKDATGYRWRFGDGQTSKDQNPKHKYQIPSTTTFNVSLVAVVEDGCSDSIGKAITINKNPDATFTYTQTGNKLELKAKTGYSNYKWKMDAKDSISTANANYTYTLKNWNPLSICLKTTDLNGCYTESCKTIQLGISNLSKPSGFKLYPNPNTGNFTIEIENPGKDVSIEVYNLIGELVKKVERVEKVTLIDLDVESGIYLVKVKNGGVIWNQKVSVF